MFNIIPIRDLRDTSKISEMCQSKKEPIFITKNGYGDMVVMSLELYEETISRFDMYNKIMEAREDVKNGGYVDGDTAMAELKAKYGRKL